MTGTFKKYVRTGTVNFWQRFQYKTENGRTFIKVAGNKFCGWWPGEIPEDAIIVQQS